MNLFKLMSATHAIGTVREKPAVFETDELPSFGWPRETRPQTPEPSAKRWLGIWQVLWPFSRTRPITARQVPNSGVPPAASGVEEPRVLRWPRRQREMSPAQRELAFETLKPIRNDLRDEDFEVTARRRTEATSKASRGLRHPLAASGRQALLSLENPVR